MSVGDHILPPVQRYQFETDEPERAHAFVRQNYADYAVRFSGSPRECTFAHTMISSPGFAIGRMRNSMAVKVDVASLGGKLIIPQPFSGRREYDVGQETIRTSRAQQVLLPPSRSFRVLWDNFDAGLVALAPAVVADYAAGVGGIATRPAWSSLA